jgi:hypothetical protein
VKRIAASIVYWGLVLALGLATVTFLALPIGFAFQAQGWRGVVRMLTTYTVFWVFLMIFEDLLTWADDNKK